MTQEKIYQVDWNYSRVEDCVEKEKYHGAVYIIANNREGADAKFQRSPFGTGLLQKRIHEYQIREVTEIEFKVPQLSVCDAQKYQIIFTEKKYNEGKLCLEMMIVQK